MSTLMIIQCSGSKQAGGFPLPVFDSFEQQLAHTRNHLIQNNHMVLNNNELRPAYERYNGQLYSNMNWTIADELVGLGELKILIVSALFGLIEYNTPIPNYDLNMNVAQHVWMHNNLLADTFNSYLEENPQINNFRSFVSTTYRPAFIGTAIENFHQWIPYSRGAAVANELINPFLANF